MNRNPKKCCICGEVFIPDHRVGQRQKACKRWRCKLERKRQAQAQWVKSNQGYFKGRYPELKEQILRLKKAQNPQQEQKTISIQDKLTINKINMIKRLLKTIGIQDKLRFRISMTWCLKNSQFASIQDKITSFR